MPYYQYYAELRNLWSHPLRNVMAFTPVCEEDAWYADQYLAEAERLDMQFSMHFDRCSDATKERFKSHPLCIGSSERDTPEEYTEKDKQLALDLLVGKCRWAFHWDIDEVLDKDAIPKLAALESRKEDLLRTAWVNTWDDMQHIRVDTVFAAARRVKFYNMVGTKWRFDHPITYGCKMIDVKGNSLNGYGIKGETDIVCIHTGYMTRALREMHKERWDRILTTAVGNNPYGMWEYCVREKDFPPTVVENPYL